MTPTQRLAALRLERSIAYTQWLKPTAGPTKKLDGYNTVKRLDKEIRELVAEIAKTKNVSQ